MKCLETSFLIDYLDGHEAAGAYLEARSNAPFFAPSLSLYEVYRGAARSDGPGGVDRAERALEWVEPLDLGAGASREAALIEAELLDGGTPINLGDVLIAGIVRDAGGTVVTNDADFERVQNLDVERYR